MSPFIEKNTHDTYLLYVFVKPNSKTQTIVNDENKLIISLRSKPIQNKANRELINLLKKKLQLSTDQIELVSGSKGSDKIIRCNFLEDIDEASVIKRLCS